MSASRKRSPYLAAGTTLVILFLYLPLAVVFANAFNGNDTVERWGGFSLRWIETAVGDARVRDAFKTTIILAGTTTCISLVLAVVTVLWWRTGSRRMRRISDASIVMRLVMPEVVGALALFLVFRTLDLKLGLWSTVAGQVVFNSALATVILQSRMSGLPSAMEEAAADLGARPRRVFRRVTLPFLAPALLAVGLLVFSLASDDVITPLFLGGRGVETLPVLIFSMLRFTVTPEVNAIAAGAAMLTIAFFAFAFLRSASVLPNLRVPEKEQQS